MESQSQELAVIDAEVTQLVVKRSPELVLAEAQKAASALKGILDAKPKKVIMNNEQYLEFEDWQTLGRFYNVTAKVVETEYVEWGTVKGFNAKAVAIRGTDGMEITAAEAMCLNDEEKWSARPEYEWRDKEGGGRERIQVGEKAVPLFQLKSMAQTRACAKALRNVLSWVVVLAGYRATPAEELTGHEDTHATTATTAAGPTVRPDGVTKVADVKAYPGKPPAKWVRYEVSFEDGRRASTFDDKLADVAKTLKGGRDIVPVLKPGKKEGQIDLERFEEAPKPPEPETPQVPEWVMVTRTMKRGETTWWMIQGSEKEYITDDPILGAFAESLKGNKDKKVMFTFELVTTPRGQSRKLTKIDNVDETPAGTVDGEVLPSE